MAYGLQVQPENVREPYKLLPTRRSRWGLPRLQGCAPDQPGAVRRGEETAASGSGRFGRQRRGQAEILSAVGQHFVHRTGHAGPVALAGLDELQATAKFIRQRTALFAVVIGGTGQLGDGAVGSRAARLFGFDGQGRGIGLEVGLGYERLRGRVGSPDVVFVLTYF